MPRLACASDDARMKAILAMAALAFAVHSVTAASPRAASAAAEARPVLAWKMADYTFAAARREGHENWPAREVHWAYPVFIASHDRKTGALNAWLRLQSLDRLGLGESLRREATHLSDRQLIARAVADADFIEHEVDQDVITPRAAAGVYRSFVVNTEWTEEQRPGHGLEHLLFNLRLERAQGLEALFKPGGDGVLQALFDAQARRDEPGCDHAGFDWVDAGLLAADSIEFDYAYLSVSDWSECGLGLRITSPRIRALLKSPRDLEPDWRLEEH